MVNIAIITHCTSDKVLNVDPYLDLSTLVSYPKNNSNKNQKDYIRSWNGSLEKSYEFSKKTNAIDLYKGRMFLKLKKFWEETGQSKENFYIVSAGLGFLRGDTNVPSYGLTVSEGSKQSISDKLGSRFSYLDWWENLKEHSKYSCNNFFETLKNYDYIFVSLTSSYIPLIVEDLNLFDSRLKLIVGDQKRALSFGLDDKYLLPYTEALDGPDSIKNYHNKGLNNMRGPKQDFAQRALLDFLIRLSEKKFFQKSSLKDADKIINETIEQIIFDMRTWKLPRKHNNEKFSDKDILIHIDNSIKNDFGGEFPSKLKLLRNVRDIKNIACEQSRLSKLYDNYKMKFQNNEKY